MSVWEWEVVDPGRAGVGGDVSKLFRNEEVKQPGVLAIGAPPADATVLVRESIQNSWDAARDLERQFDAEGRSAPPFCIRFVFERLQGAEKASLVDALGLRELADRAAANDRVKLGLGPSDCLDHLDDDDEPLTVLRIEEECTTGMGGAWSTGDSKMYLAMVTVGITEKSEGSGGSYGYGKAGLIRGSSIHTVVGYTCFREQEDEPGITRRLLGMTYWGPHAVDGRKHPGYARYGAPDGPTTIKPFENDAADERATCLGLPTRAPTDVGSLGSTFLLIDPTVGPEEVCRAVERNWWPALQEGLFDVEIESADGESIVPRPKKDEVLQPFLRAFELVTTPQDNAHDEETVVSLGTYLGHDLGRLGLKAKLDGWSYARSSDGEEGQVDHQSLVALVRQPHMVVEYYPIPGRQQPFVRGAFLADDDVDDLLRATEPKSHDAWQPKVNEEGIEPDAPKVAEKVLSRIRDQVRRFRKELKPPPPREQDIRLPVLDDLLQGILQNRGKKAPPPPPGEPRSVSIRPRQQVEAAPDGRIRVRADIAFSLTPDHPVDAATSRLEFRYVFDEDGTVGESCPITVEWPSGWNEEAGAKDRVVLVGTLGRDSTHFELVSAPYDPDWTGQLLVSGDVVGSTGGDGDGE